MSDVIVGGEFKIVPLAKLDLDVKNPRLPEALSTEGASQTEHALYIDKHHDAARVARSIERHGFFASEPLIVMPGVDDRYVVVEGNRRLVALRGLTDPQLRKALSDQTSAWKRLGDLDPDTFHTSRLGRGSVAGRCAARFPPHLRHRALGPIRAGPLIADLVSRFEDFEVVAEAVGRSVSEVWSMYRDQDIVDQPREEFEIDTSRVESSFGVFNAANGIRVATLLHRRASSPREDPAFYPIPDDKRDSLKRLFTYVFGDTRGRGRVVSDSRHLKSLGKVLADPSGWPRRNSDGLAISKSHSKPASRTTRPLFGTCESAARLEAPNSGSKQRSSTVG